MRIIINPQGKRAALPDNATTSTILKMPIVNNAIGKTCLRELLTGKRKESKGFRVADIPKPYIANKIGVESIGTGRLRQRKPMLIYVSPCKGRGISERMEGSDFATFLTAIYRACKTSGKPVEYNQLAHELGWSRNMISVYAARARKLEFINVTRQSNPVWTPKGA